MLQHLSSCKFHVCLSYLRVLTRFSSFSRTDIHGDDAPGIEDLYFAYGKVLLENAIVQNSVLGKEQPEENVEDNGASRHSVLPSF